MTQPRPEVLQKLTPVLTKRWLSPDAWQIGVYERLDGYAALRKALDVHPDDLIQLVKDSGLRGRGGAGRRQRRQLHRRRRGLRAALPEAPHRAPQDPALHA